MFELEINELCGKKQLGNIVDMCFRSQGEHKCALVLDAIKALGYKYSTVGALTVSVADIKIPPEKEQMLAELFSCCQCSFYLTHVTNIAYCIVFFKILLLFLSIWPKIYSHFVCFPQFPLFENCYFLIKPLNRIHFQVFCHTNWPCLR